MNIKISKASNVRKVHPIYEAIAESLSNINVINYVKIYNGRIKASNELSNNGKKEPIVEEGKNGIIGVELLVDTDNNVIQFFYISSSVKGSGGKIVAAVVNSTPSEWKIVVVMDWSGGFWEAMKQKYPEIVSL